MSPQLGRPCGIQYEDFDLDLPVECDDEHWRQTGTTIQFVQPDGKESTIAFFNCFLRLNQIQAFAMRTIYSTSKSKTLLGFLGPQWEQRIVADLDSALNNWMDSIPNHLRWDPRATNMISFSQSAILYAAYCALQITIHRPFISYTRALPSTPLVSTEASRLPSLTICVNAARSCVHVLDIAWQKLGKTSEAAAVVLHYCLIPVFNCGIVLMLNMLGKAGVNKSNPNRTTRDAVAEMKAMADVHSVMDILKFIEIRWHTAGKLWDMLYELALVGNLPLPSYSHASVMRSSKPGIYKSGSKLPSPRTQYPPSPSTRHFYPASNSSRPSPSANPKYHHHVISLERSAIHQTLYPKHAHLFETRHTPASPEWDLSPSMFTQASDITDTATQPVANAAGGHLASTIQSIPTLLSRSEQGASETLSMALGQDSWHTSQADAGSGSTLPPNMIWEPDFTAGELAAFQQLPATNADPVAAAELSQVFADSYSFASDTSYIFRPQASLETTTNGQLSNALGGPIRSGTNTAPSSSQVTEQQQYGQDATAFPTSSDFLAAGICPDTEEGRATLAMWSSVPTNFDWDSWGMYIHSLSNPAPPGFTLPGSQANGMYDMER